jgi:DNA-binding transcriptional ArsR family regulator
MDVLETCGLVKSHKDGRVRTYRLVPRRLEALERWMATQRRMWERRLDQLDDYLQTMEDDR